MMILLKNPTAALRNKDPSETATATATAIAKESLKRRTRRRNSLINQLTLILSNKRLTT
jgi:hypothetical protein